MPTRECSRKAIDQVLPIAAYDPEQGLDRCALFDRCATLGLPRHRREISIPRLVVRCDLEASPPGVLGDLGRLGAITPAGQPEEATTGCAVTLQRCGRKIKRPNCAVSPVH